MLADGILNEAIRTAAHILMNADVVFQALSSDCTDHLQLSTLVIISSLSMLCSCYACLVLLSFCSCIFPL